MKLESRCPLTLAAVFALSLFTMPVLAQDDPTVPPPDEPPFGAPADPVPAAPGGLPGLTPDVQLPTPGSQAPATPGLPGNGGRGGGGQNSLAQNYYSAQLPRAVSAAPQSPEMAKKMRAIMALREMWQLRLTAREISAVLPALKELADAEKTLQSRSEKLLEDERRALLAADPEGDPPPGNGELLQRENELYRSKSEEVWRSVERSLGRGKTDGLRRMIGQGGFNAFAPFSGVPAQWDTNNGFNPTGVTPAPNSYYRNGSARAGSGLAAPYGGGQSSRPGDLYGRGGGGVNLTPGTPAPAPRSGGRGDQAPGQSPGVAAGRGARGQNRNSDITPPAAAGQGGYVPGVSRDWGNQIDGTAFRSFGYGGAAFQPMPQSRISLPELVSLLGDKLAAMRK